MKVRVSKKQVKDEYGNRIMRVGYCVFQYLLNYETPVWYSSGTYGWSCDYYTITSSTGVEIVISDGYDPIGIPMDYNLLCEYDTKARNISKTYEQYTREIKRQKTKELLLELVDKFVEEKVKEVA